MKNKWFKSVIGIPMLTFLLLLVSTGPGLARDSAANRYLGMSLDQLMDIRVTSVSKNEEKLSDAAAAVFVITHEDIRRSGVTSIMEALRMAPGVDVARIDANKWAISIRGLNGFFANKLLVMIDGRSVYSPIFSGVFWDAQDIMLEDVDRIEVVRGPGASLWGANAVNGVINIITKNAEDTQGGLIKAGAGNNEEKAFGSCRYGGRAGKNIFYRVYAKIFDRDSWQTPSGREGNDDWNYIRSGFRMDLKPSDTDSFTCQGDIFDGTVDTRMIIPSLIPPYAENLEMDSDSSGGNIIGRWKHGFADGSRTSLQAYYSMKDNRNQVLDFKTQRIDIDGQYGFPIGERQEWTVGLGYRFTRTDSNAGITMGFDPATRNDDLFSAFVQDAIELIPGKLRLTLGSKLEHNDYSGFEVQPSGRILWKINADHSVWASISRAVRTPSRSEADAYMKSFVLAPNPFLPLPTLITLESRNGFDSEKLLAYELGYRARATSWLSVDLSVYCNRYTRLETLEPASMIPTFSPAPAPHYELAVNPKNKLDGEIYGLELAAGMKLTDWWRINPAYTYTRIFLHREADSLDTHAEAGEQETPKHQFSLRSSMDLPEDIEFDLWLRYTDDLPAQGIPDNTTLDVRLGWRPVENLEISLTGRNLFDNRRPEFSSDIYRMVPTEVERSFYGQVVWHF